MITGDQRKHQCKSPVRTPLIPSTRLERPQEGRAAGSMSLTLADVRVVETEIEAEP